MRAAAGVGSAIGGAAPLLLVLAALGAGCVADPEPRPPAAAPALALPSASLASAPAPGEEHRALDVLVGAWQVELFAVADGALLARGSADLRWCLAGRFLGFDVSFELEGGLRSPASGLLGYDALAGEYQWVWASGRTGRASLARGRGELGVGGLRFVSEESDPSSGAIARVRSILRTLGADELRIEQSVETASGLWRPATLTIYRRAPADADPARATSAAGEPWKERSGAPAYCASLWTSSGPELRTGAGAGSWDKP